MSATHFNVLTDSDDAHDMLFVTPVDYDTAWAAARTFASTHPNIDCLIVNDLGGTPGYMYWGFRYERNKLVGFG